VVNAGDEATEAQINLSGVAGVSPAATATVLSGDLDAVNQIGKPATVAPEESSLTVSGKAFSHSFPPHSFTVLRVKAE